jgi:phosphoribulokinase
VVIQILPTQLVKEEEKPGGLIRVRLIQKEGVPDFEPVYLFDEGSTITWVPCGRKLTCSYPGIRMFYGPDEYYGNSVSVLEVDGQFERLDEMIYVESHLSNTSSDYQGEMTELLLKHRDYPGSNNGSGLFQVLAGLKMRSTYRHLTASVKEPAKAAV